MILPFRRAKVDVACLGNHDFDYDLDHLDKLLKQTQTPWLLSNVFNPIKGTNLADALQHYVITINEIKVGFIGLAEQEWLGQINTVPQEQMEYRDFVECATKLTKKLREEDKCQIIIALTHMRIVRDQHLIKSLPAGTVDLVLGGHDHIWHYEQINESFYLKSGTNFRNLGFIKVSLGHSNDTFDKNELWQDKSVVGEYMQYHLGQKLTVDFVQLNVMSSIQGDPEVQQFVSEKLELYNRETLKIIGYCDVDLDTRFSKVRYEETNIASFYADLIKIEFSTDVAFINGGTIRADELLNSGEVTYQTLNKIFAIPDSVVKYKLSGKKQVSNKHFIWLSVSKWPGLDGRFLGVSGIVFSFDPSQEEGHRISKEDIIVNGKQVDYDREYIAATKSFVASGFDGYIKVEEDNYIVMNEDGPQVLQVVTQFFEMARRSASIRKLSTEDLEQNQKRVRKLSHEDVMKVISTNDYQDERYKKFSSLIKEIRVYDGEPYVVIAPEVSGRIKRK